MVKIADIDKNFLVRTEFDTSNLTLYNVLEQPFKIYGLLPPQDENDKFKRIPSEVAAKFKGGVETLYANTAGGRVRFKTNSSSFAVFATMGNTQCMPHMAFTGSVGFDLYVDNRYTKTFIPPWGGVPSNQSFCSLIDTYNTEPKNVTINFPLYSEVSSLIIGLDKGAYVEAPVNYKYEKPIVYYGSSITQGGCASRPGNAYQAILTRQFDCNHINLGFSGSARGEPAMSEYISTLDMHAFVCDYDYNAPSAEHLEKTLQPFFDAIRAKHPTIPFVLVSAPTVYPTAATVKRFNIIKAVYDKAVNNGDNHVYLVNGSEMMREFADDGATVDGCHPNDYGFVAMAKGIAKVLKEFL